MYSHQKLYLARYPTALFIIFLFYLLPNRVVSQHTVVTCGNNFYDLGGSVSFSIGQLVYTEKSGDAGYLIEGNQQPAEYVIVVSAENNIDNFQTKLYPNPTSENLILEISASDFSGMSFQLTDAQGKLFDTEKIVGSKTLIYTDYLSEGIYYLKIRNRGRKLKVLKFIKN